METMKIRNTIFEKKSKSNLAIKPELLQSVIQLEKGSFQKSDYGNLVYIYAFYIVITYILFLTL